MNCRNKRLRYVITVLLLACFCVSACGGSGGGGDGRERPAVLETSAPEENVVSSNAVRLDISNVSQGYIAVRYTGSNEKVKLQVTAQNTTYTYNILKRGEYEFFPLTLGSTTYVINVYENVSGTTYAQAFGHAVDVRLDGEFLPFLYPNQYVDYDADDKVVSVSDSVCARSADDLAVIDAVYEYCVKKINYDYDKAANLETTYLPDLDQVLSEKKGICFDYAALMTAMLRCQGLPTKLIVGYAGTEYHAWISVYTDETGWIKNVIKFNGSEWVRMDPTYASSSSASGNVVNEYVKNDANYNALYFY